MSKKSELKSLIERFKELSIKYDNEISSIKSNDDLSVEGKEKYIAAIMDKFRGESSIFKQNAIKFIDSGITDYKSKIKEKSFERMSDSTYQQTLANTLKILEFSMDSLNEEDIKGIMEPFKDDSLALNGFRGILSKAEQPEKVAIVPIDKTGKVIKLQESFRQNIDTFITAEGEYSGLTGRGMAIEGIISTIDNINDDLSFNVE